MNTDVHTEVALGDQVVDAIKKVYDPEIPVNVYDLGLIYEINFDAQNNVDVRMTLTAPGCPVAGQLVAQVEQAVSSVPDTQAVTVELIWDPPWTQDRMTDEAKLELGLL